MSRVPTPVEITSQRLNWLAGPAWPVEPISRTFGLVAHPLELAAYPPDDIGIDPLQGRTQLLIRDWQRPVTSMPSLRHFAVGARRASCRGSIAVPPAARAAVPHDTVSTSSVSTL